MADDQADLSARVRACEFQIATLTHVLQSLNRTVQRHETMLDRLAGKLEDGGPAD